MIFSKIVKFESTRDKRVNFDTFVMEMTRCVKSAGIRPADHQLIRDRIPLYCISQFASAVILYRTRFYSTIRQSCLKSEEKKVFLGVIQSLVT